MKRFPLLRSVPSSFGDSVSKIVLMYIDGPI